MLRKLLMILAAGVMSLAVWANPVENNSPVEAPQQEQTLAGGNVVMDVSTTPSEEVSTVEESAVAHRMTQAEKNQNAKENDSWGGAITIIAMTIVISALVILSVLFFLFGKFSARVMSRRKREAKSAAGVSHDEDHELDSGESIAAIAMALAEHFDQAHDLEDTILTIRRMKKSYSPWNSKIYNLRELPPVIHHEGSHSAFSKRHIKQQ